MQFEELKDEEMYAFVAPDGSVQVATLAPDYALCIALAKLQASKGIGQSPAVLFQKGFEVVRVKVSIQQLDDAEASFLAAKKKLGSHKS